MAAGVDIDTTVKAEFEQAQALLRAGDMQAAESVCRHALERFPSDGNCLCLLGTLLVRQRRAAEAEAPLRDVVRRFPEFAKAHEELANALLAQRRLDEAAECLRRALELEPGNDQAIFKLEKIHSALGRTTDGNDTRDIYQDMLARDPNNPDVYRLMGNSAVQQGHFGDAVVLLRKAVAIDPRFTVGWLDLGRALAAREEFADAADASQQAIELEPRSSLAHALQAGYLSRLGRYDDAIAAYNAGLTVDPGNHDCGLGLGHALRTIGRHDQAVVAYRNLIRAHADDGEAYWSLANLKNVHFEPAEIDTMIEQVSRDDLSDDVRAHFLFALGKAFEDEADYERSFSYYKEGNAARRQLETYDPVDTQTTNDRVIDVFDKTFLDDNSQHGNPDPAPIFIVGLPRTGSTLIEQVLASHSKVDGTRELPELERIIEGISQQSPAGKGYPQAVREMNGSEFTALGSQYLQATQGYRQDAAHFTDKMPTNFRNIGLIHLVLPNAKIVNARRHPLDSCMGSYKQLFARGQPYSYDLFELGEYYLEYQRLMDHWHAVLPGRVLDVQYEDLVADPEQQIRRVIKHCELPWEDACLDFHQTERAIESASSEQVRQPIYDTSVNNWRRYEALLGDLIEILQPVLEQLPAEQRPARRG